MGMFDNLIFDAVRRDGKSLQTQTKDLDCCLLNYKVADDGRLYKSTKAMGDLFEPVDLTKTIEFYFTDRKDKLRTFEAKFRNGRLKEIEPING